MNKVLYFLVFTIFFGITASAQTGEIQGKLTDENGKGVGFAQVRIVEDEEGNVPTSKGARTDAKGRYTIKGLSPGSYYVMAKALGKPKVVEQIQVYVGRPATLNFSLEQKSTVISGVTIKTKRKTKKIIDVFTPKENVVSAEDVKNNSVRDVNSLAGATGQVVQEDMGAALNVAGGRDDGNTYFIDGVKVTGSSSIPPSAIGQIEIITSGVPAKYGDATGGVISITSKGPSNKLRGAVEGLTSRYLDPWGYSLLNATVSGPILRRKPKLDSIEMATWGKNLKGEVALGFMFSGEFQHDVDRFPTVNGLYKLKDNVRADLLENPYALANDGESIFSRAETVTGDDIEVASHHENTSGTTIRLNGKLDWKVNRKGTNVTVGGRFVDDEYSDLIARYAIFNPENNRTIRNKLYNGYLRLYQPLSNSDKQAEKSLRNASFQIQMDYERSGQDFFSPVGGFNPWAYGYIGRFTEVAGISNEFVDNPGNDNFIYYGSGKNDFLYMPQSYNKRTYASDSLIFDTANYNRTASQFMRKFIDLYNDGTRTATTMQELGTKNAVVNGSRASIFIHSVFFPMSRVYNGFQKEERDQFRVSGNVNFDLVKKNSDNLNKHTIEAGFELEQRFWNRYFLSPNALWSVADASINSHLAQSESENFNPLLIMRGGAERMRLQDYIKQINNPDAILFDINDTVYYDSEVVKSEQTAFSKNFRERLGLSESERVNINSYSPEDMQLSDFSADQLISSGLINSMYGYNYLGERVGYDTKFQDFFNKKDENGNYTREVAARAPRYAAAYVQDRFQLKDMALNIGLRVDYFDANTFAFRDPYVPQLARTIGEVPQIAGLDIIHPSELPSDAVVYVDNPTDPSKVVGYRSGNTWYNSEGRAVKNSNVISNLSGGQLKPYLKGETIEERNQYDISSEEFNPDLIFQKTDPIINVMPRVNFSFNIDTNSLIFAHIDFLAQRPVQDFNLVTPLDYYNVFARNTGARIANPNLQSPKSTDLELGFKQKLSRRSSFTLNFYYREYRDQLQVTRIDAYPFNYITYGNLDFSTVKGFGLAYELRRTNNIKVRTNYTMQFAEGTGSSTTSQLNLVNQGQGNVKVIAPLNFDVRHNINLNFDYRFAGGDNYNGPKKLKKVLQNMGLNVQTFLRSGKPYTQQRNITQSSYLSSVDRAITLGGVNSASMPWGYNVNLKLSKGFTFKWGKRDSTSGKDLRKKLGFDVYLQVNNLLNTFRTLSVYRYTGDATTDGYVNSGAGVDDYARAELVQEGNGEAFRDLYNMSLELPRNRTSMFARPRIIQLGGILSF